MELRAPYNYDTDKASDEAALVFTQDDYDESVVSQAEKDECDINVILKRFGQTGVMPQGVRVPMYGDFVNAVDFRTSMDAITQAQESFMMMPADVRAEFANDPQRFLVWCNDEKNYDRALELGLAVPKPAEPSPVRVEITNPAPADGADQ